MPTYDYRCPNGHDFEHFVRKISESESQRTCAVCGAVAQRRVSGGAGLVFKGSGFYLTDYGKNAHRTSGPESGGGESKGEPAGESKGEAKSESKAESSGDSKAASKTDTAAKSDGGSGGSAKADGSSGAASKSDGAKSTDSKPSSGKTKGGDSK
jgi:putative FmdB family regulatory protein